MFHSLSTLVRHKYQSKPSRYPCTILAKMSFFLANTFISLCKSLIRKLLIKDELRRIGSRAGASDVKTHPFFRTTQWALLRHMKPPMIPHQGRAIDTLNFRNVKESQSSVDMGNGLTINTDSLKKGDKAVGEGALVGKGGVTKDGLLGPPGTGLKGVPLDSGLATPKGEMADPFEEFNSVTLHHDGEDQGHHGSEESSKSRR